MRHTRSRFARKRRLLRSRTAALVPTSVARADTPEFAYFKELVQDLEKTHGIKVLC